MKLNVKAKAAPSGTPETGRGEIWFDSTTKKLSSKDDAGVTTDYDSGGGGGGDVVGPGSSVDNSIPKFDSTTGKIIQESGVTINDENHLTSVRWNSVIDSASYIKFTGATFDLVCNGVAAYNSTASENRFTRIISIVATGTTDKPAIQIGGHTSDTGIIGSATHFGCVMGGVMQIYCDSGGTEIEKSLSVGIEAGTTAAALVEFLSTTQGYLGPRMTTTQKNAISTPVEGLEVYDTTLKKKCFYNGSAWETITSS